jgi:hypothetical protein
MKTILLLSSFISLTVFSAEPMCPPRTQELVSCKENLKTVSICQDANGERAMTVLERPRNHVELYDITEKEDFKGHVFSSPETGLKLTLKKSNDDHTTAVVRSGAPGRQRDQYFRCVTRFPSNAARNHLVGDLKVTTSGISAGAYMAQQYHFAFSNEVSGVGIIAGGPYFCARGNMFNALNRCMKTIMGVPHANDSVREATKLSEEGKIDPISNIAKSKIYAISGLEDDVIQQRVVDVALEVYKDLGVTSANMHYENKLPLGHAFPTEDYGNECSTSSRAPYISSCHIDGAGQILNHLLGKLLPKKNYKDSNFYAFDQLKNVRDDLEKLSMNKTGYAYIPEACKGKTNCRIHVAFHGCFQTLEDVETSFIMKTGYNEWAEANNLIIFYPQSLKNRRVNNPNGCWDWWGYTGDNYHTKEGAQMKVVHTLVQTLKSGKLPLTKANLKRH